MACLSPEHEPPQRSRTETALYHTREHVVAWVVVAILAISRLILIAQFDEFVPYNHIGDTPFEIEASIARYCSVEWTEQCRSLELVDESLQFRAYTVRLEVQEGGRCDVVLTPQPFLVALSKEGHIYQSRECPFAAGSETYSEEEDTRIYFEADSGTRDQEKEDQLFGKNLLNEKEEQLLDSFNAIALRLLLSSKVTDRWTQRYRQIYLGAMLELMSTSEVERESEVDEPAKNRLKVKLYLDDKVLPTGKLDRTELHRRLMDSWEKMQASNAIYQAEELPLSLSSLLEGPPAQPLLSFRRSPLHRNIHYQHSEKAACIRHLFDRNQLLVGNACSVILPLVQEKGRELEVRWDCPLAAMVRWIYFIFCVLALFLLSSDVGHSETKKQRWRRQFRQMLQDPLLRQGIERSARKRFNGNEQQVAEYMTEQEARAAQFEAADADLDWKRSEAKLEAWKQKLHFLWVLRRALAFALLISCGLSFIDRPKAGVVLDGAMFIVLTFGLTYVCLPKSPTQQSKKGIKSGLEEPLLVPETRGCP